MWTDVALATLGVAGVGAFWVAVQNAWRAAFPEAGGDGDVLAGRGGCHGCGCSAPCARASARGGHGDEEERT